MNHSGDAVSSILAYYKGTPSDLLVVQDEMDYEPGTFAFLLKGGFAGHKGIASIAERLGVGAFPRLRIGIGRAKPPMKSEDYVLEALSASERKAFDEQTSSLVRAMKDWATKGIDKAMNVWNVVKSVEPIRVD
jgi:PTH1 family peptidyl-tRNA hydrolase